MNLLSSQQWIDNLWLKTPAIAYKTSKNGNALKIHCVNNV